MKTIRRRDGTTVTVDDSYLLANGETWLIPWALMDSKPMMDKPPLVHDGRGNPAGCRPGFRYSTDAAAEAARIDAYRIYDEDVSSAGSLTAGRARQTSIGSRLSLWWRASDRASP